MYASVVSSSDLKWLQQVSYVFSDCAGALYGDGVVLVSQGQPVNDDNIDVYQIFLHCWG